MEAPLLDHTKRRGKNKVPMPFPWRSTSASGKKKKREKRTARFLSSHGTDPAKKGKRGRKKKKRRMALSSIYLIVYVQIGKKGKRRRGEKREGRGNARILFLRKRGIAFHSDEFKAYRGKEERERRRVITGSIFVHE